MINVGLFYGGEHNFSNPLPDLLNTGFTMINVGLFYGGEHMEAKICRFLTFFTRWLSLFNRR